MLTGVIFLHTPEIDKALGS